MYQLLERSKQWGHACSDFYPMNKFFLQEENAVAEMNKLMHNKISMMFDEVVHTDDDGTELTDWVTYNIEDCYKVEKIIPFEEMNQDTRPF